jgi:hypothetical protein
VLSIRVWLNNSTGREKRFFGAKKEMSPRGDYWVIPVPDIEAYAYKGRETN